MHVSTGKGKGIAIQMWTISPTTSRSKTTRGDAAKRTGASTRDGIASSACGLLRTCWLEERVLVSQILAHVGLMEDNDAGGVELASVDGGACRDAKAQGHVAHAQHDDAGVLGRVVCDATQVGFDDMVAVQKGQLAIGLDPDFEARILCEVVECRDVQPELARLAELAKACTQRHEVRACHRHGLPHGELRHVVDAVAVQAKHMGFVGAIDEVDDVVANIVRQLGEERFGLFFGERTHGIGGTDGVSARLLGGTLAFARLDGQKGECCGTKGRSRT